MSEAKAPQDSPLTTVGILGVGVMGLGLGLCLPQYGYATVLWTRRDPESVRERLRAKLEAALAKGLLTAEAAAAALSRVEVTPRLEELARADLVIEAVAEDPALKRELLGRVEACCSGEALLASTTSSLCISALAEGLRAPGRFLGLHFFNPVPSMKLVEVVPGPETAPACLGRALAFVRSLEKEPVLVQDGAGFVVNRLVGLLCNRAVQLLEEGTAGVEEIDSAMRLGASHPLGPLELGDVIGWDTTLVALTNMLEATHDEAYRPRPLLRHLVDTGRLGRKVGRGLYEYDAPGGKKVRPTSQSWTRGPGELPQ